MRHRVIGAAASAGLLLATAGCGLLPAAEEALDTGATTTVDAAATTTTALASPQAGAVRSAAAADATLPADVVTLVNGASGPRLDELGQAACGRVTPGMPDAELDAAAIVTFDLLTPEETALVDLAEFQQVFRLLAGAYCPAAAEAATTTTTATSAPPATEAQTPDVPPADPSEIAGYRSQLPTILGADHAAVVLVGASTDARIDELQQAACAVSSPELDLTAFGLAVLRSYQTDLTDPERAQVTIEEYAELFGSFVGWFCLERLPIDAVEAGT